MGRLQELLTGVCSSTLGFRQWPRPSAGDAGKSAPVFELADRVFGGLPGKLRESVGRRKMVGDRPRQFYRTRAVANVAPRRQSGEAERDVALANPSASWDE